MTLAGRALLAVLIGLSLGATLSIGSSLRPFAAPAPPSGDVALLSEVMQQVRREYVDPIDDATLVQAAIRGMVADLDAHSQFLDPDQYADIRVIASGQYSGVGLEVTMRDGAVTVIAPFAGSPAARAGIRSGDRIVAVDGQPVSSASLFDTVHRLRGAPGTLVSVAIERDGSAAGMLHELRREDQFVRSIDAELLAPAVGYVRISQFHDQTAAELRGALRRLKRENLTPLTGLILDLRNNPGGLLDAAIDVADLFLGEGVIVSARGRTPSARFEYHADPFSMADDARMIVLVNGASASAAEIVAGALQDHERAELLGTSTFGKGLVQTVMPLDGGQALKITTSRYYTPSGAHIQNRGLTPDVVVHADPNGAPDLQLEQALRRLGKTQLVLTDR